MINEPNERGEGRDNVVVLSIATEASLMYRFAANPSHVITAVLRAAKWSSATFRMLITALILLPFTPL